ncbi:MAG: radical SAM protein [Candidatus Diapherotrites archaeon]|nr:radical SAM protein [Candidatus Diapherotrites archaeon]
MIIRKENIGNVTCIKGEWFLADGKNIKINTNNTNSRKLLGAPLELIIYPSLLCDQNCDFCYIQNKTKGAMSKETVQNIKNYILEKKIFAITILGGEPLLPVASKISQEFSQFAYENEVICNLTTNGANLQEHINWIKKYDVKLTVSIEGTKDIHNKITHSTSYDNVLNNLKALDKKLPFSVSTIINRKNINNLYKLRCELLKFHNLETWLLLYAALCGNLKRNRDIIITLDEFFKTVDELKGNVPITVNAPFYFKHNNSKLPASNFDKLFVGCSAGKTKAEILPNGDIYPCCFMFDFPTFKMGNINKKGNWWEKIQKEFNVRPKKCINNCKYAKICTGCIGYTINAGVEEDDRCPYCQN